MTSAPTTDLLLIGRSSSHYTRVARIAALELGVDLTLRPVFDLWSLDAEAYASNPALRIPILVDERGPLYGTENICRELARRSSRRDRMVLRAESADRLVSNAEELVLHVMSSEVSLLQAMLTKTSAPPKIRPSIENALAWLDDHLEAVLERLPADRTTSFFEIALFAVVSHLPFREVMEVTGYARLARFVRRFEERDSASRTPYAFDVPPRGNEGTP